MEVSEAYLRQDLRQILGTADDLGFSANSAGLIYDADGGLSLAACLLIGAIVSTTDPSAVVTIFRSISAPRRLARIIEGESLLNDAAAIALFGLFMGFVMLGAPDPRFGDALARFPVLIAGGALTGWLAARVAGATVIILSAGDSARLLHSAFTFGTTTLREVISQPTWGLSPAGRLETGRWLNNQAERAHLPFRRRERAMLRFRRMRRAAPSTRSPGQIVVDRLPGYPPSDCILRRDGHIEGMMTFNLQRRFLRFAGSLLNRR